MQKQEDFPSRVMRAEIQLKGALPARTGNDACASSLRNRRGFVQAATVDHDDFEWKNV